MENPMSGLKTVQAAILRKLEAGHLPVESRPEPNSAGRPQHPCLRELLPERQVERLTPRQAARREVIKNELVLRYRFEKELDALSDDDLFDVVRSLDQHLTYAGVPTARLPELYLEAMAHHGAYLLKVDDWLRAWGRLNPAGGAPADLRPMNQRGSGCSICHGTGMTTVYDPKTDTDFEKECPYHCEVVTAVATL